MSLAKEETNENVLLVRELQDIASWVERQISWAHPFAVIAYKRVFWYVKDKIDVLLSPIKVGDKVMIAPSVLKPPPIQQCDEHNDAFEHKKRLYVNIGKTGVLKLLCPGGDTNIEFDNGICCINVKYLIKAE